jgi:hypothetical protein
MVILLATLISIIILCSIYEAFKNAEITDARKQEEAAEENRQAKNQVGDEAPDTERQLVSDITQDDGRRDSDVGAKKASRVKTGDHSVI